MQNWLNTRKLLGAVLGLGLATNVCAQAPIATEGSAAPTPWKRYGNWTDRDSSAFNTLANLASPPPPEPGKMQEVATPIQGDPENGMKLSFDRGRGGSCLACHIMGEKTGELPGNVGPDLSTIGTMRPDDYLYNYVYDARAFNPQTVMPPWGAHEVFTPDEIKDVVAFLKTLTKPKVFDNPNDDPNKRPVPVENRDNLDPTENQGMWAVDEGAELFQAKGPEGKSCADCHASPEETFKTWSASMPKWEPRMNKVLGVEEFITRHAKATTGAEYLMQSDENIALSVYLRNLANGTPINVDIESEGAKEAAERGKALMDRKIGQLNMACTDCHNKAANHWTRGQWLGESKGQIPHFPTWRTSRTEIWDIRKRFQWCNVAIRANELPPDAPEYGEIELYLTWLNNGLPVNAPGIRH